MDGHDPLRFANDLGAKLASRSRHVCVFMGAGTSRACGLPDVAQLQERVVAGLESPQREQLSAQLAQRNLEQALSRIRTLSKLLDDAAELDGLSASTARDLDESICRAIVAELAVEPADLEPVLRFASWAARADYRWPLELFTVNYDLLLETAFEELRVPYFDGFVGTLEARFHTELVEAVPEESERWLLRSFVRLWKLHGSVNWSWDSKKATEIVRRGMPAPPGTTAAIYPSDAKYDESRRMPFIVLQDRLRRALSQPETLTLITGYAFGDEHLNEMIFDAAARRPRSEIVAFCYSKVPAAVKGPAQRSPNLQVVTPTEAILGGYSANWEVNDVDSLPPDLWVEGKFALGDFGRLASYLARTSPAGPEPVVTGADDSRD